MSLRLVFGFLLWPSLCWGNTFFNEHREGWFWYRDPPRSEATTKSSPNLTMDANQAMEKIRNTMLESLNLAILDPTEENLREYAKKYYAVIHQGQHFADAYKLMLMKSPEFDYYLRFPVNHNARLLHNREQEKRNGDAIRHLAKTHGFFFFFSGDCTYCRAFAPTVKRFSQKYGISILPITLDGKRLPEYPEAQHDTGVARKLGVRVTPALFAVHPGTRNVVPLANGLVSVSDLEDIVFKYADFERRFRGGSRD